MSSAKSSRRKSSKCNSRVSQALNSMDDVRDKIIDDARKRRVLKLKSVNDEVKKELDAYKAYRDEQCERLEAEAVIWRKEMVEKTESRTQVKIQDLQDTVDMNKEKALERLLSAIFNIEPELHINLQL